MKKYAIMTMKWGVPVYLKTSWRESNIKSGLLSWCDTNYSTTDDKTKATRICYLVNKHWKEKAQVVVMEDE